MTTTAEAISIGTQKFLESNMEWVGKQIQKGTELAIIEVSNTVGFHMANKVGKFMAENKQDFVNVFKEMVLKEGLLNYAERTKREKGEKAFDLPEVGKP
jgi:hypothetical protein